MFAPNCRTIHARYTSSTRQIRCCFLLITGLAACSFPIVTREELWHRAFADDHDADFLLDGVTDGFRYQFFNPFLQNATLD
jgi:hypothetical protein